MNLYLLPSICHHPTELHVSPMIFNTIAPNCAASIGFNFLRSKATFFRWPYFLSLCFALVCCNNSSRTKKKQPQPGPIMMVCKPNPDDDTSIEERTKVGEVQSNANENCSNDGVVLVSCPRGSERKMTEPLASASEETECRQRKNKVKKHLALEVFRSNRVRPFGFSRMRHHQSVQVLMYWDKKKENK